MSWLYELSYMDARQDILTYLGSQDDSYFEERGRTRESVMSDDDLIDELATEHMRCVNNYGNEREWSCRDACDNDPGFYGED